MSECLAIMFGLVLLVILYFMSAHGKKTLNRKPQHKQMMQKPHLPQMQVPQKPRHAPDCDCQKCDTYNDHMVRQHMSYDDGSSDYTSYMVNNALESSVVKSHSEYVKDANKVTTGPSVETIKSGDDFGGITFVGLRRPNPCTIPMDESARTVPSFQERCKSRSKIDDPSQPRCYAGNNVFL